MERFKIVIVGDGACGKTCLLVMLTKGTFPQVYVPTVFENYSCDFTVGGKAYEVNFWDTAGQDDYDRLRPLSYPDADAFIISFGFDWPDSLDNVVPPHGKWHDEINHFNTRKVPVFLVGCKKDLSHDPETLRELKKTGQVPVTEEKAQEVRKKIGAVGYYETSAKTGDGALDAIKDIIEQTRLARNARKEAKQKKKKR